mgnify:CR=1 FL=1
MVLKVKKIKIDKKEEVKNYDVEKELKKKVFQMFKQSVGTQLIKRYTKISLSN